MSNNPLVRTIARLWHFARRSDGDRLGRVRRFIELRTDQAWTLLWWRLRRRRPVAPYDGDPRFGLVTVNFSTTRLLKLMLLTLCDQVDLHRVCQLVIVDNDSRDGGKAFLEALSARVKNVHLARCRFFLNHARGMRRGVALLDRLDAARREDQRTNLLLCCDTDIIFRNPSTLGELGAMVTDQEAAFAGELRFGVYAYPEAQASFFTVRRDCYARPDVVPFVNHGAPAYWMQRSLWCAGLHLAHFPSNTEGYILHRGRSGSAAARKYRLFSARSTATIFEPHYMGVAGGEEIWKQMEQRHAKLLEPSREPDLVDYLADRFTVLGSSGRAVAGPKEPRAGS